MNNTTVLVKELRQATGASFLDCKQALLAHDGNYEQATAFLRQKNLNKAAKKAERQTTEGLIVVKTNETDVSMVALNCETDFVALTPDFKALAHQLAELVLADKSLTDAGELATAPSTSSGQAVLPTNPTQTVQEAIQALIGKLGENIKLGAVARYTTIETGIVHGYVHAGAIDGYGADEGRLGVLVAVAVGDETIAHDLALHIASAAPEFIAIADIPAEVLAEHKAQLWAAVADENKPDAIKEKMVAGRLNKFYQQNCLLEQPFLKDDSLTVAEWLQKKGDEMGTAVSVLNFTRVAIDT
ncbi:MAG: translation elongation factor Ts [Anaerolineae bacterium]|nr:translation elongation factor Ts [Anaerolineae bacterium]